ncbi:MAG TPA: PSD1 and planctomycete cytochrome C domain-containing protein [Humisphaera sp.]
MKRIAPVRLPVAVLACLAIAAVASASASALPPTTSPASAAASADELFVHRVLPLLQERCVSCHGGDPDKIKGELDLRTAASARRGGESGKPLFVPGKPDESPIVLSVRRDHADFAAMPPKANDRLTPEQIEQVRAWVAGGAPWPEGDRAAELKKATAAKWEVGERVRTSGGLGAAWTDRAYKPEDLWAYRPVRRPAIPAGRERANPVDALIDARLAAAGLPPAPPADRRTLIRRATYDLTGLPPTAAEVYAFVADPAPDAAAFAAVVDRLLASPHYGEQYARHWLDVARYADTAGFANDYERGPAWRYRDYVVRSFNADKPYDRFVREQLAGDEVAPGDPEALVATGFLRMGPWELTGMEVAKVARQRFLDDVTDAVGQVFLGHMLQCARCHDHKFDPVPTRDYYAIQAALATTQLADRPAPFVAGENTGGFEERQYLEARRAHYERQRDELNDRAAAGARRWYAERKLDPAAFERALAAAGGKVEQTRAAMRKQGVPEDRVPPKSAGFTPADFGLDRIAGKGLERLRWAADRYEPVALAVYAGATPDVKSVSAPPRLPKDPAAGGEVERTCILPNGDPFSPGAQVAPGALSAVEGVAGVPGPKIPTTVAGRRAALADWVASPANPLTARVMVNRLWQWHFGEPIAGTPNNFGATGKKPTHPELLDLLADEFVRGGWSVKRVHRLIMTSEAYRRGGRHPDPAALAAKDPLGTSYAAFKPRRLSAEELRDSILQASGELNPAVGGIPARPELNAEVALQPRQVMGTYAEAWQPSVRPEQRHRRTLYTMRVRGLRDPFLDVFNAPAPDLSCERRDASTVTPQVFALFNAQDAYDRALAMAARAARETTTCEAAVARAVRLAFGRDATPDEVRDCLAHWDRMTERHRGLRFDRRTPPRQVVREAVDENTGERFTFTEPLEAAADFVPDLQPADATPEVRGLAEVCLVLLNANEFAYVY